MPKLRYRMPKMSRNRGTAIVKIDGEPIRLGKWGSPEAQEAYDRVVNEWLANGRRLPPAADEPEGNTVTVVCVEYVAHANERYGENEADNIRRAIRHVRKLYGSTSADEFGPKRLRAVRQSMIDAGWSRGNINKQVSRIRQAFKWAASHELCS